MVRAFFMSVHYGCWYREVDSQLLVSWKYLPTIRSCDPDSSAIWRETVLAPLWFHSNEWYLLDEHCGIACHRWWASELLICWCGEQPKRTSMARQLDCDSNERWPMGSSNWSMVFLHLHNLIRIPMAVCRWQNFEWNPFWAAWKIWNYLSNNLAPYFGGLARLRDADESMFPECHCYRIALVSNHENNNNNKINYTHQTISIDSCILFHDLGPIFQVRCRLRNCVHAHRTVLLILLRFFQS